MADGSRSNLAFVISLVVPGAGHGFRGQPRRGAYWIAFYVGVSFALAVLSSVWLGSLVLMAVVSVLWYVACAADARRVAKGNHERNGWIALAVALVIGTVVAPVILPVVVRQVAVEAWKIPSGGMCPTLAQGDHVFGDKTAYRAGSPKRGDVVIYRTTRDGAEYDFVQRVVATGGDEIEIGADHRLTVNGESPKYTPTGASECGGAVFEENGYPIAIDGAAAGKPVKLTVPQGHLFMLGDNRANSADSRMFGTVSKSAVQARAWKIWLSGGSPTWRDVK